jgi:hypothetical protein
VTTHRYDVKVRHRYYFVSFVAGTPTGTVHCRGWARADDGPFHVGFFERETLKEGNAFITVLVTGFQEVDVETYILNQEEP